MITSTIEHLLEARPFLPFTIHTTGGNQYHVATSDHAGFNPAHSVVIIWFDNGGGVTVPAQHIATVATEAPSEMKQ